MVLIISDEAFRYIALHDWYASAMSLLETVYGESLVSGLLHSVGSQVESLAGVATSALEEYLLSKSEHGPEMTMSVLSVLQSTLALNINQNRIFVPAVATATRILAGEDMRALIRKSDSSDP